MANSRTKHIERHRRARAIATHLALASLISALAGCTSSLEVGSGDYAEELYQDYAIATGGLVQFEVETIRSGRVAEISELTPASVVNLADHLVRRNTVDGASHVWFAPREKAPVEWHETGIGEAMSERVDNIDDARFRILRVQVQLADEKRSHESMEICSEVGCVVIDPVVNDVERMETPYGAPVILTGTCWADCKKLSCSKTCNTATGVDCAGCDIDVFGTAHDRIECSYTGPFPVFGTHQDGVCHPVGGKTTDCALLMEYRVRKYWVSEHNEPHIVVNQLENDGSCASGMRNKQWYAYRFVDKTRPAQESKSDQTIGQMMQAPPTGPNANLASCRIPEWKGDFTFDLHKAAKNNNQWGRNVCTDPNAPVYQWNSVSGDDPKYSPPSGPGDWGLDKVGWKCGLSIFTSVAAAIKLKALFAGATFSIWVAIPIAAWIATTTLASTLWCAGTPSNNAVTWSIVPAKNQDGLPMTPSSLLQKEHHNDLAAFPDPDFHNYTVLADQGTGHEKALYDGDFKFTAQAGQREMSGTWAHTMHLRLCSRSWWKWDGWFWDCASASNATGQMWSGASNFWRFDHKLIEPGKGGLKKRVWTLKWSEIALHKYDDKGKLRYTDTPNLDTECIFTLDPSGGGKTNAQGGKYCVTDVQTWPKCTFHCETDQTECQTYPMSLIPGQTKKRECRTCSAKLNRTPEEIAAGMSIKPGACEHPRNVNATNVDGFCPSDAGGEPTPDPGPGPEPDPDPSPESPPMP